MAVGRIARAGLIVLVTAAAVPSAVAVADEPPACPAPAVAYEGDDVVVRELRMLRDEQRAACLTARHDADRAHDDAAQAHDDATALAEQLDDPPATTTATIDDATLDRAAAAVKPYGDAGLLATGVLAGLGLVGLLLPTIRRYWP